MTHNHHQPGGRLTQRNLATDAAEVTAPAARHSHREGADVVPHDGDRPQAAWAAPRLNGSKHGEGLKEGEASRIPADSAQG